MNDHDQERIGRYFDGELSDAEAALMERKLDQDPAWRAALDEMEGCRSATRGYIEEAVKSVDFDAMWSGIETRLPAAVPEVAAAATNQGSIVGPWRRLQRWWSANWTPIVVSAAAAAIVAVWVTHMAKEPDSIDGATRSGPLATGPKPVPAGELVPVSSVVVDAVRNDGNSTVLISMPVEEGGATVIWLLEENEENGGAGDSPPDSEEPI